MKIAIDTKGFDGWAGGVDFVYHVVACLSSVLDRSNAELDILISEDDWAFYIKKYVIPNTNIISRLLANSKPIVSVWNGFRCSDMVARFRDLRNVNLKIVGSTSRSHLRHLNKNNYDVVLPLMAPPSHPLGFHWVGYLYDFQHKYFPEYFSLEEIKKRDAGFKNMLLQASDIIVNAKSVSFDIEKFFPDSEVNVHILPFSPRLDYSWVTIGPYAPQKFDIRKPYIIICNQFWIHKDHKTAIHAFSQFLNESGMNIDLVCTGKTDDYRFPGLFKEIKELIHKLKIEKNVHLLGHIDKSDQISLLKNSLGLIQPTTFEGGPGGGSVYEAISLGIPAIVSDIPVNLEIQEDRNIHFFKAGCSNSLCSQLFSLTSSEVVHKDTRHLIEESKLRQQLCGDYLLNVIKAIVQNGRM